MSLRPRCSSSYLTRDGHDERGRIVYACAGCGRHATTESTSLISGHRFPRDVILLAVRYYLLLGAAAECIDGILADRGHRRERTDDSALGAEVRAGFVRRDPLPQEASVHDQLVDETYVKIPGTWHYLYRGVDEGGQVLDCWMSRTRDLAAATAFFGRTISSTRCLPEHVVTNKATFYPSAIRTCALAARHTATGF